MQRTLGKEDMERNYYLKAIVTMVIEENYTDRGEIADELGITRRRLSAIIRNFPFSLRVEIEDKLKKK